MLLTFGLGCIAATLTAFLRDTAHGVGVALTVGFYATPIVYPVELVPLRLRPWIEANPLTTLVELYRGAFTLHALPRPASVAYLAAFCAVFAFVGFLLFSKGRPHFADLI